MDGGGDFQMELPSGRYALVALPDRRPGPSSPAEGWLLWVEVREGPLQTVILDERNLYGTDCDDCVVAVKDLP